MIFMFLSVYFWGTPASAPIGEMVVYFSHKPPKTVVGVVQTASSGPGSAPSARISFMGMDGMGTYGARVPCPSARTSGPSASDIDNGWGLDGWGWGWEYLLLHLPFFIRIRERLPRGWESMGKTSSNLVPGHLLVSLYACPQVRVCWFD